MYYSFKFYGNSVALSWRGSRSDGIYYIYKVAIATITISFQSFYSTSNGNLIPLKLFPSHCELTSSFDSFCDLLGRKELSFEHGHNRQLVLSEEQAMFERPVAEKKEGGVRKTKKRKKDGWGWRKTASPRDREGAEPCPGSLTLKLRAVV